MIIKCKFAPCIVCKNMAILLPYNNGKCIGCIRKEKEKK